MPVATETTGESSSNNFSRGWKEPTKFHFAIVLVVLIIAAAVVFLVVRKNNTAQAYSQIRASGIPSDISTPLANLMELSPSPSNTAAPNFTLTDQNGKTYSLSSFRGKSVVLEFMDPNCTDICPLVSQEFVNAYHDLGTSANNVVFIAVNVNKYHLSTAAVTRFTNEHNLNQIPNWHFFTGQLNALTSVWHDYGITVDAPSPTADVIHTSIVFFIGPNGHERFIATPMDYHTKSGAAYLPASQLTAWGKGIALVSRNLI